jgi:hypothetical protein
MFASMRDKQRRFMELTMGDDLTPVLAYYEHPKPSDSVPKGVMFLDQRFEGFDITTFELRREMEICSGLSSTHEGAQSVGLGLPSDVHVVTDLLIGFESSIDHANWLSAIKYALLNDADSKTIALTSPTLLLAQVIIFTRILVIHMPF